MKRFVFSVYDSVSQVYSPPMVHVTKGAAVREFEGAVKSVDTFKSNPQDFTLYYVGRYDDCDGLMIPEKHERLALASDFTGSFANETK